MPTVPHGAGPLIVSKPQLRIGFWVCRRGPEVWAKAGPVVPQRRDHDFCSRPSTTFQSGRNRLGIGATCKVLISSFTKRIIQPLVQKRRRMNSPPACSAAWRFRGQDHAEILEVRCLLSAAHDLIGVTDLRADPEFAGIDGSDLTVVVIDSGVDVSHPLISPNYVFDPVTGNPVGQDFIFGGTNPIPVSPHGTHVAGIIGASDPDIGVAPGVNLIGLQVGLGGRAISNAAVESALQWVIEHRDEFNIVAVNMSLGGGLFLTPAGAANDPRADEIDFLESQGVAVVSAAGNSFADLSHLARLGVVPSNSVNRVGSPGILSTFDVGAVYEGDPDDSGAVTVSFGSIVSGDLEPDADQITVFSQRPLPSLDSTIFAPGATIESTVPITGVNPQGLAGFNGTSMAAPMVSGAVALLQQTALQFGGQLLPVPLLQSIVMQTADVIVDNADDSVFLSFEPGDPASDGQLHQMLLTGQAFRRINVHKAAQAVVDFFAGLEDTNGTISTASPGREVFVANGALSPIGQLRLADSQRPIVGSIGNDGDKLVGAKDVDFYELSVLSPGELTITTSGPVEGAADTFLRLFDPDGTELGSDDNSAGNGFSRITIPVVPAGTYFVAVSGAPNDEFDPNSLGTGVNGSLGDYQLSFALSSADIDGTIASATDLGAVSGDSPLTVTNGVGINEANGHFDQLDVVDMFRIEVPESGVLRLDIDTFLTSGGKRNPLYDNRQEFIPVNSAHDTYLRLFDAEGTEIAFNNDALAAATGDTDGLAEVAGVQHPGYSFRGSERTGNGTIFKNSATADGRIKDSYLETELGRGVYYIGVSSAADSSYNPLSTAGRDTASMAIHYDLTALFEPHDTDGSISRASDSAALMPGMGEVLERSGEIGRDGVGSVGSDVDMLRIVAPSSGLLDIQVNTGSGSGIAAGEGVDSTVTVYSATGLPIAGNDDHAGSLDARIQLLVTAGEELFVAIAGSGAAGFDPAVPGSSTTGDTGKYQLQVTLQDAGTIASQIDDTTSGGAIQTVSTGTVVAASIGNDDGVLRGDRDIDLFRFNAAATGRVTIETLPTGPFSSDTFLRVFRQEDNGDFTEVAFNDNVSTVLRHSSVEVDVVEGVTYLIGVSGTSLSARSYDPVTGSGSTSGDTGEYLLRVNESEAPEVVVAGLSSTSIEDGDSSPSTTDGTSFGTVTVDGSTLSRTFTVSNTGTATLTTSGLSVPAGYTVTEPLSASIAAGSSDTFTVRLDAATAGTKSGQISFTTNDSDETPYNFSITGSVQAPMVPEIAVTGLGSTSIADGDSSPSTTDGTDFGSVTLGGTALSRTFTVSNTGTATLTTSGLSVPAGYTITEPLSSSIAPGNSDTFTVRLDAAAAGTKSGEISFTTNDSDENPYNFSVTGSVQDDTESISITVGEHRLLPNRSGQVIQLFVTGGAPFAGMTLRVQIGDGGPEAGGSQDGPSIQTVDILTGTVFESNNTGLRQDVDGDSPDTVPQFERAETTTNSGTVSASGLLATITIDTTGFTEAGDFDLKITGTADGDTSFAPATAPIELTNGTISIVDAFVAGRQVFYNNSVWDGQTSGSDSRDDQAIATDKQALLPGQTASFANYTNYSRGLNGVMVDIAALPGIPAAADFQFRVGNDNLPSGTGWSVAPAPQSISVRPAAGVDGSDRVTITWADNQIAGQWLQVVVLPTAATGLAVADEFFFGNAVGDSGNSATNATVDTTDEIDARNNTRSFLNPAGIDFPYDYNRDKSVDTADEIIARQHVTFFQSALKLISPVSAAVSGSQPSAAFALDSEEVLSSPLTSSAAPRQAGLQAIFSGTQPLSQQSASMDAVQPEPVLLSDDENELQFVDNWDRDFPPEKDSPTDKLLLVAELVDSAINSALEFL
ncbi:choice-of-anchor D domain-containing protein [bacterium]|nr:choice-of-anchor D domain-containing protein [bacterium]